MFAIALWDGARRRLLLARDRFGIKPLYYRARDGGLEFASELRALPRGDVDLDALEAFLAFNSIPAPLSIFHDTSKLPPGHLLVWDGGEPRLERYARPAPAPADQLRHESETFLAEELRATYQGTAVRASAWKRPRSTTRVPERLGSQARIRPAMVWSHAR
jgi:asparagine synthase (glutamine-hydrolysing)